MFYEDLEKIIPELSSNLLSSLRSLLQRMSVCNLPSYTCMWRSWLMQKKRSWIWCFWYRGCYLFYSWGNTFPIGPTYNSRPIQRTAVRTSPKQVTSSGAQWCFGTKRSVLGGTMSSGHLPVQRNSSHNTMIFSHPGLIEVKFKPQCHVWRYALSGDWDRLAYLHSLIGCWLLFEWSIK